MNNYMSDKLYRDLKRLKKPGLFRKFCISLGVESEELISALVAGILITIAITMVIGYFAEEISVDSELPTKETTSSTTQ